MIFKLQKPQTQSFSIHALTPPHLNDSNTINCHIHLCHLQFIRQALRVKKNKQTNVYMYEYNHHLVGMCACERLHTRITDTQNWLNNNISSHHVHVHISDGRKSAVRMCQRDRHENPSNDRNKNNIEQQQNWPKKLLFNKRFGSIAAAAAAAAHRELVIGVRWESCQCVSLSLSISLYHSLSRSPNAVRRTSTSASCRASSVVSVEIVTQFI